MNTIDKLFNELVEQAAAAAEKRVLEQLENMITPDKVLDVKETAEYLGVSPKLIYQLCAEKVLPHIQAGGSNSNRPRILFRQATLDRWLREQEEASLRKEVNLCCRQ